MIKTEKQAIDSIHARFKASGGVEHKSYVAYIGTDPSSHRKILFERATKDECVKAVRFFYASFKSGAAPGFARGLTPDVFADIRLAKTALAEAGMPGVSFYDMAREYITHHAMVESVRLPEALRRYLESFSAIQKAQIKCVRSRVGMFVEAYREALVTEIRPKDVADYLFKNYHQKSPKTYNEVLGYIRSFFNWCKRKDVALCVENPCDDLRGKSIHYEEPEFVTAETVRHVFDLLERKCDSVTKQQVIWFFAIWFFCGIRTEEILRLRHKDVNLDEGWIRVAFPKGFQHGVAPRMVEMPDVCKAWLRAYDATPDGTDDKFIDRFAFPHYAKSVLMKAAKDCGETDFKLVDNAGRHSFVTMHVALYNNPSRTEALAGTSKDMRVNNYMGLATKAQAEAYFNVYPTKGA